MALHHLTDAQIADWLRRVRVFLWQPGDRKPQAVETQTAVMRWLEAEQDRRATVAQLKDF